MDNQNHYMSIKQARLIVNAHKTITTKGVISYSTPTKGVIFYSIPTKGMISYTVPTKGVISYSIPTNITTRCVLHRSSLTLSLSFLGTPKTTNKSAEF